MGLTRAPWHRRPGACTHPPARTPRRDSPQHTYGKEQRMSCCPASRPLDLHDWEQIHDYLDRFEDAWHEGEAAPPLTDFLPPPDDRLRPAVLEELIKTELEIRCRRGHV